MALILSVPRNRPGLGSSPLRAKTLSAVLVIAGLREASGGVSVVT